mgnify:CR=1 FL=1
MGIEDPDADVADQQRPAVQHDEDVEDGGPDTNEHIGRIYLPLEADPMDVADQHTVVPIDDEDDLA